MKNASKKVISNVKLDWYVFLFIVLFFFISINESYSQNDSIDIYDLNLTQLSKLKITSASKVAQNINEVPSTVFVITGEQIKENGYFTLEEALSELPGFQFRNINGINSYVFQRGIPNQNNLTLLLIDGVQINELNSGGFYAGGQFNLSNIERIEVIYGPSSLVYGTNAVSGIINIITKNPTEKKINLNALAGNFNTFNVDLNSSYVNKKNTFGVSVSGMYKTTDKANLKGFAGDNNWTNKMDNFENDYVFDLKINARDFVLGTNYIYKETSTATSEKSVGTIYRDYGTTWNIQFVNSYLKYNKKLNQKLTFTSQLYNRNATVLDNTIYSVLDTAQVGYYRPNNLTGFENILDYTGNEFGLFSGGLTFEYEQLSEKSSLSYSNSEDQKPPKPEKPKMVTNYLASIFVEPRFTLFKNLFLSTGARFDQSSIYDQVLTPRIGISYNYKKQLFRLSYVEAYRAPKPWDYTDGLGNSSLLPEKMKSLEAAFTFSLFDNYKIDIIGYKNDLDNAITKEIINDDYRWVNSGEIKTDGIEIYLRYVSSKLKTSLNYTFNQSYNEVGEFVPEISKHTGNASITYYLNQYIRINLRANYIGKRENPKLITSTNSYDIDPCLIFHGAMSLVNYKGFTVQLIAKNILNTEYYHTSNRDPDRYRQAQRTIMFTVGYVFK